MCFRRISLEEVSYNKITLSFSKKNENLFRENYFIDSLAQLRVSLVFLIFLYGLFGLLDLQVSPENASTYLKIRFFLVIPIALIVFLLSYTKIFQKIWQGLLVFSLIVGGIGITIMTTLNPENNIYYTGLMLVFFSGYLFLKLRFFAATIGGWSILLIFNFLIYFFAKASPLIIISTNFFFISANLVGMIAAYYHELQIRRNFLLNYKLDVERMAIEDLNKNLEKTVANRTKELLKAKDSAEATNANISAILEGTTENIWAFDTHYKILYVNKVFQNEFFQTFGIHLLEGVNLIDSLPEPLKPFWKKRYDRVLANEQFTLEDAIDTENGTIYIQVSFNPIIKQGRVVGGSCIGSNITHRKLAELELVKAKEKAEESDQLKSAFLANMSHEIRTPMNGILGFAELLKQPNLSGEEQHEYISIIEQSGVRMLNIINDIVDISKIEAGLMEVNYRETNILEHINYIYSFFKPEAEKKGLKFILNSKLPENEAFVKTDSEKLYAILTNLIKNAIKYTNEGAIEYGCIRKGSKVEFFIKDTGIGIPKERQEAIFERFIQVDMANKMTQQGAGLGLAISKAFLIMLGGEMWVESEQNIGSTFYFTLPAISSN